MPDLFSVDSHHQLAQAIEQQLIREFTQHSRPQVEVNSDRLTNALNIRVRIFGDLAYSHTLGFREIHESQGGLIDQVLRHMTLEIRRAPAQPRPARPAEQGANLVNMYQQGLISSDQALTLLNAPDIRGTFANINREPVVTLASIRAAARDQQNSDGSSDSGNQSELGDQPGTDGVAPSRGDIGASSTPKLKRKPTPKSRWQRLLGEDLV